MEALLRGAWQRLQRRSARQADETLGNGSKGEGGEGCSRLLLPTSWADDVGGGEGVRERREDKDAAAALRRRRRGYGYPLLRLLEEKARGEVSGT